MQINLKETMDRAGISQYRLAKEIDRQPTQVNKWYHGKTTISRVWQERLMAYFSEKGVEVVTKE